jgi:ABC-type branched-subunit amino acid transport system ATPase component
VIVSSLTSAASRTKRVGLRITPMSELGAFSDLNAPLDAIEQIRKDDTAILIVEQDATSTFGIADRVYVLEHGRTVKEGRASDLAGDEYIRQVYLGV